MEKENLQKNCKEVRKNLLASIFYAESGHPGGSLSPVELLTYLWKKELNWNNENLLAPERDRFVLSKGHACPALYAVAAEVGILQHKDLKTFRKLNSSLQGHPHTGALPWVETSTGSLGQGFSAAIGMAMGLKYQKLSSRVYVMMGDGEIQEGEVWEGAMCAAHHHLDNLCAIIDYNKMQSDDLNQNIMGLEPLADKWRAFGWHVIEIDGHNLVDIERAFAEAKTIERKPTMIIAHTVKGKGVSYMEASPLWHGSVKLSVDDLTTALGDLGASAEEIGRYIDGSEWK